MTTTVDSYLSAVARELDDLPATERDELLEDLASHLSEVAVEGDLYDTLGDPVAYARELRAAAGLGEPLVEPRSLTARLRDSVDAARRSRSARSLSQLLRELRPAWWIARAWLAVAALAGEVAWPVPPVGDNRFIGLIFFLLAAWASVTLGRRAQAGRRQGLNLTATVLGAIFALTVPAAGSAPPPEYYRPAGMAGQITTVSRTPYPGALITDREGRQYRVEQMFRLADGRTGVLARCPGDVAEAPQGALRGIDGTTILCVGTSPELPRASVPPTSVGPPTTAAPATTAPAPTTPPTTAAAPTSTAPEPSR